MWTSEGFGLRDTTHRGAARTLAPRRSNRGSLTLAAMGLTMKSSDISVHLVNRDAGGER